MCCLINRRYGGIFRQTTGVLYLFLYLSLKSLASTKKIY